MPAYTKASSNVVCFVQSAQKFKTGYATSAKKRHGPSSRQSSSNSRHEIHVGHDLQSRSAENAFGPDHPDTAVTLNNLAVLYHSQGRYAEAWPLYQQAIAIHEKVLGPDHPDTITAFRNYEAACLGQPIVRRI